MLDVEQAIRRSYPNFFDQYPKFISNFIIKAFKKLFHEKEINDFLAKNDKLDTFSFITNVLKYFDFKYTIDNQSLTNIPETGKVIFIANHPLGALDALSLIHLIATVRTDIKVLSNELLANLDSLMQIIIPIDNITGKITKDSAKEIVQTLNDEGAIIIFPAGEVSRLRPSGIRDTKWHDGFLKFAKKTGAPVVPVHISARNSIFFYGLSVINKPLSAVFLPNEMFKQREKSIEITIGEMIPFKNLIIPNITLQDNVHLVKKHLYGIGKSTIFKTQQCIIKAQNKDEIKKELANSIKLGDTKDEKIIYLASTPTKTVLLKELGRLREITFRKVGEGTGKNCDIDEFDLSYKHLVLFDPKNSEIVGAYRIGESEILKDDSGVPQFYTRTLFKFEKESEFLFHSSIELGRSFVVPKYWGTRALDYLWYGIGAYLRNYPQTRYMFGPVSISVSYPKAARDMLVFFYKKYFGLNKELVLSNNRYFLSHSELNELEEIFCGKNYEEDFSILKQNLTIHGVAVPTLYKQYCDLCEEGGVLFLDFGIDPDFDDCTDGFIVIDTTKIKESKKKRYIYADDI